MEYCGRALRLSHSEDLTSKLSCKTLSEAQGCIAGNTSIILSLSSATCSMSGQHGYELQSISTSSWSQSLKSRAKPNLLESPAGRSVRLTSCSSENQPLASSYCNQTSWAGTSWADGYRATPSISCKCTDAEASLRKEKFGSTWPTRTFSLPSITHQLRSQDLPHGGGHTREIGDNFDGTGATSSHGDCSDAVSSADHSNAATGELKMIEAAPRNTTGAARRLCTSRNIRLHACYSPREIKGLDRLIPQRQVLEHARELNMLSKFSHRSKNRLNSFCARRTVSEVFGSSSRARHPVVDRSRAYGPYGGSRSRSVRAEGILGQRIDPFLNANRQVSFTMPGSAARSATASRMDMTMINGRGGLPSTGSNSPFYTSHFLERSTPDERSEMYESRLALALDIDLSENLLSSKRSCNTGQYSHLGRPLGSRIDHRPGLSDIRRGNECPKITWTNCHWTQQASICSK